jgi:hypothetical protein
MMKPSSRFTDALESEMTAYFCARYENQKGDVGEWGPIVSITTV